MARPIEERTWRRVGAGFAIVAACCAHASWARQSAPAPASPPAAGAAPADGQVEAPMSDEQLEQLLAPLALYPDSLLSQVLMASTYPVDVVQADRWAKGRKDLKGDALATELEKQPWDPSVKSLINFPDVLGGMSEKLDWTVDVGDAFIADQKRVLDAVQRLRNRANAAGNLKSSEQQNVTVTQTPGAQTQTIVIESTDPDVVYVPSYDTTVVYGGWPYPAYPPYPPPYYPPYYQPGAALVGFGVGLAVGAAWGYAWGGCNWGRGDVDINVNRNTNINTKIDRSKYQNRAGQAGGGKFQHDPARRQGAAYRDSATAKRYGGETAARTQGARDQYRGRAEAGRQDLSRPGATDAARGAAGSSIRDGGGAGATNRAGGAGASDRAGGASASNRAGGAGVLDRAGSTGSRSPSTGASRSSGGAFSGAGSGGASTRAASSRGGASRSSAGMSRGGGGGGRGGGRRG